MIWALIITMVIKMIAGPDEIFTIPKLKKEIKSHVSDNNRKDSLLLIVKEAKKEIKTFNKVNNKDKKKLKKLLASDENEMQGIENLINDNFNKRKELQKYSVDKRLATQDLMTDEEWKNVIQKAVSPSGKAEKKDDKSDRKYNEAIEKFITNIEKSILKKMQDSPQRKEVLAAFQEFSTALKALVKDGLDIDYQNNKIVGTRSATRQELEDIYANQNDFRENVNNEFSSLYYTIYEQTNKNERKAVRKELKKMFK